MAAVLRSSLGSGSCTGIGADGHQPMKLLWGCFSVARLRDSAQSLSLDRGTSVFVVGGIVGTSPLLARGCF
jgi:hypothetical protein